MSQIMIDGEWVDKWHTDPLGVEEGDRVRFTHKPPKAEEPQKREATGVVKNLHEENNATIDVDDAGTWRLKYGAVLIIQQGRSDRNHGTLLNIEKIPYEGMKVVTDTGVVGEVQQVKLDRDKVQIQRSFNPTQYWVSFDEIEREVR